jgi:hypothetical protein
VQPGLTLRIGAKGAEVKDLQRDLRSLGYLRAGIDGAFGPGTESAVKALQIDLMRNGGEDAHGNARAPVAVRDFNTTNLDAMDGILTQPLAACIARMIDAPEFTKLPSSLQPRTENAGILPALTAIPVLEVPLPFLVAILEQESGLQHYRVPSPGDDDNFILVGLDTNDKADPMRITSRGYGVGQYSFFHHPLTQREIGLYVRDVAQNVRHTVETLREKFTAFVAGPSGAADDHAAEHPQAHAAKRLRKCRYAGGDPLYMRDCRTCLDGVKTCTIRANQTPWFKGSPHVYVPTRYHPAGEYRNVPVRAEIPCDWPYAVRRYNGSGINSFHYQTRILQRVLAGYPPGAFLGENTMDMRG